MVLTVRQALQLMSHIGSGIETRQPIDRDASACPICLGRVLALSLNYDAPRAYHRAGSLRIDLVCLDCGAESTCSVGVFMQRPEENRPCPATS